MSNLTKIIEDIQNSIKQEINKGNSNFLFEYTYDEPIPKHLIVLLINCFNKDYDVFSKYTEQTNWQTNETEYILYIHIAIKGQLKLNHNKQL